MEIEFSNWKEYQQTTKRYNTARWFAVSNAIWQSDLWDALSGDEFKAFVFLLSQVSQRAHNTGCLTISERAFCRMSGMSPKVFNSTIKLLCDHGAITVNSPCNHGDVTGLSRSTRQDKQDIQDTCKIKIPDLLKLWNDFSHKDFGKISDPLSTNQKRKWRKAWKENSDVEFWKTVISSLGNSNYHRGRDAAGHPVDGAWIANIDWLLKPGKAKEFLGSYRRKKPSESGNEPLDHGLLG